MRNRVICFSSIALSVLSIAMSLGSVAIAQATRPATQPTWAEFGGPDGAWGVVGQKPMAPAAIVKPPALARLTALPAKDAAWFLQVPRADVRDQVLSGFENAIVIQKVADATIENVRIVDTFDPNDSFRGQGIYFNDVTGTATVRGCYFGRNGWQLGRLATLLNEWRHGIYGDTGLKRLIVEDCIFDSPANSGIQFRGAELTVRRCLFLNCGVAIYTILGVCTVEDCTIYGAHRWWVEPDPKQGQKVGAWVGRNVMLTYTTVNATNVWAIGGPDVPDPIIEGARGPYDTGAILCGRKHDKFGAGPRGGEIIAKLCRVHNWPGKTFAGDKPHNGVGFSVTNGPAVIVDTNEIRTRALVDSESIADLQREWSAKIRGSIK